MGYFMNKIEGKSYCQSHEICPPIVSIYSIGNCVLDWPVGLDRKQFHTRLFSSFSTLKPWFLRVLPEAGEFELEFKKGEFKLVFEKLFIDMPSLFHIFQIKSQLILKIVALIPVALCDKSWQCQYNFKELEGGDAEKSCIIINFEERYRCTVLQVR